ncbi:unnamed protein product [Linum trigynum]|uniref:Uncharacterized protein n=1 Tax=Linum trigynum TaxID=586398 RepID=A0AAV2G653_9ROSI
MNSLTRVAAKQLQIKVPNSSKLLLQMSECDSKAIVLVGAMESDSTQTIAVDEFLEVFGRCRSNQFVKTMLEQETPNFELKILGKKILQQNIFEQPSFDPLWDQFYDAFDKRKDQAFSAKLFEEGEPDMIQIGHFYKSQLLAKEAIKVGKKKGRIWLSQNPCSGYILWRHDSLNWLCGNSMLRVCIADKVSIFPMVCFVDPDDVIKVVFQGLKFATSKLENCQNLVKAETVFKKPTLELHSRSMDEILVQRLIPHESRYVLLQRHGIG